MCNVEVSFSKFSSQSTLRYPKHPPTPLLFLRTVSRVPGSKYNYLVLRFLSFRRPPPSAPLLREIISWKAALSYMRNFPFGRRKRDYSLNVLLSRTLLDFFWRKFQFRFSCSWIVEGSNSTFSAPFFIKLFPPRHSVLNRWLMFFFPFHQ